MGNCITCKKDPRRNRKGSSVPRPKTAGKVNNGSDLGESSSTGSNGSNIAKPGPSQDLDKSCSAASIGSNTANPGSSQDHGESSSTASNGSNTANPGPSQDLSESSSSIAANSRPFQDHGEFTSTASNGSNTANPGPSQDHGEFTSTASNGSNTANSRPSHDQGESSSTASNGSNTANSRPSQDLSKSSSEASNGSIAANSRPFKDHGEFTSTASNSSNTANPGPSQDHGESSSKASVSPIPANPRPSQYHSESRNKASNGSNTANPRPGQDHGESRSKASNGSNTANPRPGQDHGESRSKASNGSNTANPRPGQDHGESRSKASNGSNTANPRPGQDHGEFSSKASVSPIAANPRPSQDHGESSSKASVSPIAVNPRPSQDHDESSSKASVSPIAANPGPSQDHDESSSMAFNGSITANPRLSQDLCESSTASSGTITATTKPLQDLGESTKPFDGSISIVPRSDQYLDESNKAFDGPFTAVTRPDQDVDESSEASGGQITDVTKPSQDLDKEAFGGPSTAVTITATTRPHQDRVTGPDKDLDKSSKDFDGIFSAAAKLRQYLDESNKAFDGPFTGHTVTRPNQDVDESSEASGGQITDVTKPSQDLDKEAVDGPSTAVTITATTMPHQDTVTRPDKDFDKSSKDFDGIFSAAAKLRQYLDESNKAFDGPFTAVTRPNQDVDESSEASGSKITGTTQSSQDLDKEDFYGQSTSVTITDTTRPHQDTVTGPDKDLDKSSKDFDGIFSTAAKLRQYLNESYKAFDGPFTAVSRPNQDVDESSEASGGQITGTTKPSQDLGKAAFAVTRPGQDFDKLNKDSSSTVTTTTRSRQDLDQSMKASSDTITTIRPSQDFGEYSTASGSKITATTSPRQDLGESSKTFDREEISISDSTFVGTNHTTIKVKEYSDISDKASVGSIDSAIRGNTEFEMSKMTFDGETAGASFDPGIYSVRPTVNVAIKANAVPLSSSARSITYTHIGVSEDSDVSAVSPITDVARLVNQDHRSSLNTQVYPSDASVKAKRPDVSLLPSIGYIDNPSRPRRDAHPPIKTTDSPMEAASRIHEDTSLAVKTSIPAKRPSDRFKSQHLTKIYERTQRARFLTDESIIQRYDFVKKLGKGGFGEVWKAVDRQAGDTVAIKIIPNAFRYQRIARRTYREVSLLLALGSHPHIVPLIGGMIGSSGTDVYMICEVMDADLWHAIQKWKLKDGHQRRIMQQLLSATMYLHSATVAHRDYKPENILINKRNLRVKVCDLGFARAMSQVAIDKNKQPWEPDLTVLAVSKYYSAPEILLSSRWYTTAVDMWSLGCILAEMVTEQTLFYSTSSEEQIEVVVAAFPHLSPQDLASMHSPKIHLAVLPPNPKDIINLEERFKDFPEDAADLCKRLLQFNPTKRLTAEEAMTHPYVIGEPCSKSQLKTFKGELPPDETPLEADDYRVLLQTLFQQARPGASPLQRSK